MEIANEVHSRKNKCKVNCLVEKEALPLMNTKLLGRIIVMGKYIAKKIKSSDNDQSVAAAIKSESTVDRKTKKTRLYCVSYLKIGFTCGYKAQSMPNRLTCNAKLSKRSYDTK